MIAKILEIKPNIIYNRNSLNIDIAYLTTAYNIVGGKITTFLNAIIPLNNNLKNLWIFLFEQNKSKKEKYFINMKYWSNKKFQRNLMIDEKCINDFQLFSLIN